VRADLPRHRVGKLARRPKLDAALDFLHSGDTSRAKDQMWIFHSISLNDLGARRSPRVVRWGTAPWSP